MKRAKVMLERNQYPPNFYNPIIADTITKIHEQASPTPNPISDSSKTKEKSERLLFITQYRGKTSDELSMRIRKISSASVVFTTRKLKTCQPSLKALISKGPQKSRCV